MITFKKIFGQELILKLKQPEKQERCHLVWQGHWKVNIGHSVRACECLILYGDEWAKTLAWLADVELWGASSPPCCSMVPGAPPPPVQRVASLSGVRRGQQQQQHPHPTAQRAAHLAAPRTHSWFFKFPPWQAWKERSRYPRRDVTMSGREWRGGSEPWGGGGTTLRGALGVASPSGWTPFRAQSAHDDAPLAAAAAAAAAGLLRHCGRWVLSPSIACVHRCACATIITLSSHKNPRRFWPWWGILEVKMERA